MVRVRALDAAAASMDSAIAAAVQMKYLLQRLSDSAEAPRPHSAALPLAAMVALFAAVSLIFHHLRKGAAAGDQRLSELVTFMLCASVGILEHVLFVQHVAGVVINVGALGLGLAVATAVTFFLGVALVLVYVCSRSGGGAVGGEDGPVVRVLSKSALGAAAAVLGFMAMAAL